MLDMPVGKLYVDNYFDKDRAINKVSLIWKLTWTIFLCLNTNTLLSTKQLKDLDERNDQIFQKWTYTTTS